MFSPCYFHVIISIGILESNSLSLSTPSRTKWTLVYLLMLYSTSAEGHSESTIMRRGGNRARTCLKNERSLNMGIVYVSSLSQ